MGNASGFAGDAIERRRYKLKPYGQQVNIYCLLGNDADCL
jgi:hypothetical protein